MILSIGFSVVFYRTSTHELGRQLPPRTFITGDFGQPDTAVFNKFFQDRISEASHSLLQNLFLLNLLALIAGTGISYYLARRTLEPIEEAMDAQSRFSSDASHELRTPLTAIRAQNEVALRKSGLSLAEAKNIIKSNLDQVTKLEKLSEGLLRLAKEDGKSIALSPVSLQEMAAEAMNKVVDQAQAKKIAIEDMVPDIKVLASTPALSQAITILLDNAIKYGNPGSTIYLEGYQKGRYAYLSVKDEGPGMRASDLSHIFERFYRADHSRTKQGDNGYGLGLSIAKKIIDQYGGEISVDSTLDTGSVFTIKLASAES